MHRDYIMRIIEQFARALASIIASRKANNHEEAFSQIRNASQQYLETDITALVKLDADQLLNRFRTGNGIDSERCIFCADLFFELALVSETKNFTDAAYRLKTSCLNLYLAAIPTDPQFQIQDYYDKASRLIQELDNSQFSDDVLNNLQLYQNFLSTKTSPK